MTTKPHGLAAARRAYWRWNLLLMSVLLLLWAFVSFGLGILWAEPLNNYAPFGVPLGFWFAQQGSIVVFVFIVLTYAIVMNRLDRWHHEDITREHLKPQDESGEQA
ncbi:DUF4212 domain-containing protein [Mucisphaera sp.]|uniref:DUF4212 domain-containing protein n=1 Tax=Mucisphaera sp. TaxID=2913024 RepID=UPI003D10CD96